MSLVSGSSDKMFIDGTLHIYNTTNTSAVKIRIFVDFLCFIE